MNDDSDDSVDGGVPLPTAVAVTAATTTTNTTITTAEPVLDNQKAKKPALTHFLCIPLHHSAELHGSLDTLAKDISAHFPSLSIPKRAMRPAQAAHLTLGVMSLPSEEMVERAIELLRSTDVKALLQEAATVAATATTADAPKISKQQQQPLMISLRGLATMNSPKRATLVYTRPHDPTDRLQPFADAIRRRFVEEGLIVDEKRDLKLHLTLVNTVYARSGGKKAKQRTKTLDVEGLLEKFGERVLVDDVAIDRVSICLMGARRKDGVTGAAGYREVFGIGL